MRSDVIVHYKKKHANQAVLCPICNVPIFAKLTISYKLHFTRVHPDIEFPLEDMDEDEYEAIVEDDDMDLRVNCLLSHTILKNKTQVRYFVPHLSILL